MFTIGDLSKVTGLPVKTLRFYHEKGLLIPVSIDRENGYRYYDTRSYERARIIIALRDFEFSLEEIGEILSYAEEESDILAQLERQKIKIEKDLAQRMKIPAMIDRIIETERQTEEILSSAGYHAEVKEMEPTLVAGIRINGKYADMGPAFATLGKKLGRHIIGKPLCLYHDGEYRETDANFEPCMPVRRTIQVEGIDVRELPATQCVTMTHLGPYEELGRSYAQAFAFASEKNYQISLPTREVYLKGPGMIFRGKPHKYLTEIQLPIVQ